LSKPVHSANANDFVAKIIYWFKENSCFNQSSIKEWLSWFINSEKFGTGKFAKDVNIRESFGWIWTGVLSASCSYI